MEYGHGGGKLVTTYLIPGVEWGILGGIDFLLDLREIAMKTPSSKQKAPMLGSPCSLCNDSMVKLFKEEV